MTRLRGWLLLLLLLLLPFLMPFPTHGWMDATHVAQLSSSAVADIRWGRLQPGHPTEQPRATCPQHPGCGSASTKQRLLVTSLAEGSTALLWE
jgi:hypothetical protein